MTLNLFVLTIITIQ
jgi:hypothetical protein